MFGADLWASDWNRMTPQQELKLLTDRLNSAGRGIILLHDPKTRTAAMLPAFLRYLADNHYRVVHIVPAAHDHVPAAPSSNVRTLHLKLRPGRDHAIRAPVHVALCTPVTTGTEQCFMMG